MFAVDTNVWIALLNGESAQDVHLLKQAAEVGGVFMPPVVLSEVMSDPYIHPDAPKIFEAAHLMVITNGYWKRTGLMRAGLIAKGFRPKLPDTLITQSCLDHNMPLLTRDEGFKLFSEHCGLKLV